MLMHSRSSVRLPFVFQTRILTVHLAAALSCDQVFSLLRTSSSISALEIVLDCDVTVIPESSETFPQVERLQVNCQTSIKQADGTKALLALLRSMPDVKSLSLSTSTQVVLAPNTGQEPVLLKHLHTFKQSAINRHGDWSRFISADSFKSVKELKCDSTDFFADSAALTHALAHNLEKLTIDEDSMSADVLDLANLQGLSALKTLIVLSTEGDPLNDVLNELEDLPTSVELVECEVEIDVLEELLLDREVTDGIPIPDITLPTQHSLSKIIVRDFDRYESEGEEGAGYLLKHWFKDVEAVLRTFGVKLQWSWPSLYSDDSEEGYYDSEGEYDEGSYDSEEDYY